MVGAVLVKRGTIIGKGFHKRPGAPHAEVIALNGATTDPKGGSLYVNLEPCCHFGRTPPCVDLILAKGIARVVIGTKDTNPMVNGKSMRRLRQHGVRVDYGILEERCRRLNEVFLKYITTRTPFVILKAAITLDGRIASSSRTSQWISSEQSRKRVHRLRNLVDAIAVGIGTVLQDDPQLTARGIRGSSNPLRIVMDSMLRIPLTAQLVQGRKDARTLIATTPRAPTKKMKALTERGIEVEVFENDPDGRVPMDALFNYLGARGIQSVLVEGGSHIYTSALQQGLVDKLVLFLAPTLMGGRHAPGLFEGKGFSSPAESISLEGVEIQRSGRDILVQGYPGKRTIKV